MTLQVELKSDGLLVRTPGPLRCGTSVRLMIQVGNAVNSASVGSGILGMVSGPQFDGRR